MKKRNWITMLIIVSMLTLACSTSVLAAGSGDVAGAVEKTWTKAATQIKTVVNKVVFPAGDMILAVLFFDKVGTAYMDYKKHGEIEWTAPAILFICLVFTLTAPIYIWQIVGI